MPLTSDNVSCKVCWAVTASTSQCPTPPVFSAFESRQLLWPLDLECYLIALQINCQEHGCALYSYYASLNQKKNIIVFELIIHNQKINCSFSLFI